MVEITLLEGLKLDKGQRITVRLGVSIVTQFAIVVMMAVFGVLGVLGKEAVNSYFGQMARVMNSLFAVNIWITFIFIQRLCNHSVRISNGKSGTLFMIS